jgi:hypothetical protein
MHKSTALLTETELLTLVQQLFMPMVTPIKQLTEAFAEEVSGSLAKISKCWWCRHDG